MLEVRAGETAELLCAGLRVAAGVKAVLLSPGTPATRRPLARLLVLPHEGRDHTASMHVAIGTKTQQ